ncbi:Hypothetical predicted protein, partial [Paramuricea clavata]
KLHRRKHSVDITASLNDASRQELKKGLIPECMSPEESETDEASDAESGSDEEERQEPRRKTKKIYVRPLSWRSKRFSEFLASLDRKAQRRRSDKSTMMTMKRQEGQVIVCDPPSGIPNWMKVLQ